MPSIFQSNETLYDFSLGSHLSNQIRSGEAKDDGWIRGRRRAWPWITPQNCCLGGQGPDAVWVEPPASPEVSRVARSLRRAVPEADPEVRIHVCVILKDIPPGGGPGRGTRTGQGREPSKGVISGKVPEVTCIWEDYPPPPGWPCSPQRRRLGFHSPLPQVVEFGRGGPGPIQSAPGGSGRGPNTRHTRATWNGEHQFSLWACSTSNCFPHSVM